MRSAILFLVFSISAQAQGLDLEHQKIYEKVRGSIVAIRALAPLGERSGTGTILDREGLILTSYSVVPEGSSKIRVWIQGPRLVQGDLVGTSKRDELSLIRIKPSQSLSPIEWGESVRIKVGEISYTIGNAANSIILDDQPSLNVGIISGLYKLTEPRASSTYTGLVLETTAAVNVGMEGAPLLNAEGKMIGFVTLNYSPHRFLGGAIPIDSQKFVIAHLLKGKTPPEETPIEGEGALGLKAKDEGGRVQVIEITPGGAADQAGIRIGDTLLSLGKTKIKTCDELWKRLVGLQAGDIVWFTVEGGGETFEVKIELEKK